MKENICNWFKKHERICGVGLLFLSLCSVAFGGSYLGAEKAIDGREVVVRLEDDDTDDSEEDNSK